MDEEARHAAYRERRMRIKRAQRELNRALTPLSEAAADATRANWKPLEQFVREGPNVGHTDDPDEPDLKKVPRFN